MPGPRPLPPRRVVVAAVTLTNTLTLTVAIAAGCGGAGGGSDGEAGAGDAVCRPGATACDGGWFLRCARDGRAYAKEAHCVRQGLACDGERGCVDPLIGVRCAAGEAVCKDGAPWRCDGTDAGGTFKPAAGCGPGERCLGAGQCAACADGQAVCVGGDAYRCEEGGGGQLVERCDPAVTRCAPATGACVSRCGDAARPPSYQGCQFWAVDLDDAAGSPFAVAVAGVADVRGEGASGAGRRTARVTVSVVDDPGGDERVVGEAAVEPGALAVFDLTPRDVEGPARPPRAYRVEADLPVAAYQLNPPNDAARALSNDASLLLPQDALGEEYVVATGDAVFGLEGGASVPRGAFVAVVGATDEPVDVTVDMTADFEPPDPGGPIGEVAVRGRTVTARLHAHDVLSLRSVPVAGGGAGDGNLSGARVRTGGGPVAVFAGNVATVVPHDGRDDRCCADHLEEQLWPVSAWGRVHVGAGAPVRNGLTPEGDAWRVTAGPLGADLAWRPARPDGAPERLLPLESVAFETGAAYVLDASEPVQLVHFLKSSGPVGDPAMTQVPPVERWRADYVFLTPPGYAADFIVVEGPREAAPRLDGDPLPDGEWAPVAPGPGAADAPLGRWIHRVSDGPHALSCAAPVGLMAFGYDRDGSYGYPGGLDL